MARDLPCLLKCHISRCKRQSTIIMKSCHRNLFRSPPLGSTWGRSAKATSPSSCGISVDNQGNLWWWWWWWWWWFLFIITAVVIVIAFWLLLSILVFVDSARCGNVTVAVSTPLSIWSMLLIRIRLRCRYHQHHNCRHHYILLSPSLWASPTSSS